MQRSEAFEGIIATSQAYLTERQESLGREYRLWKWPRYDWSQETRQLVFSEHGIPQVIADIQFVGSISTLSDTWLWAWANPSIDAMMFEAIKEVRAYGEKHDFAQLTTAKWHAHEVDGWEMTALTAYLLRARGAYRTPDDTGFTFMVMTALHWPT